MWWVLSSCNFILLVTLWPTYSNNSARYKMAMILEHWFRDFRKRTARGCQGAYGELHGKLSISPAPFFVAQLSAMSRLAGLNCPEFPETLSSCPGSSVIFALLLVEFTLLFSSSILVLLVLRDQIIHVGLGLSELHLIHTLTGVPVQEGLAGEQK